MGFAGKDEGNDKNKNEVPQNPLQETSDPPMKETTSQKRQISEVSDTDKKEQEVSDSKKKVADKMEATVSGISNMEVEDAGGAAAPVDVKIIDSPPAPMNKSDIPISELCIIYPLNLEKRNPETREYGKQLSVVKIPDVASRAELYSERTRHELPEIYEKEVKDNYAYALNIVMVESSHRMNEWRDAIMQNWNSFLPNKLDGETHVYTFNYDITYRGKRTDIPRDYTNGGSDLGNVFMKVRSLINKCPHHRVRFILLSMGNYDTYNTANPEHVLAARRPPKNKRVDVYCVALGNSFQEPILLLLRKHFHNGPESIPYAIRCYSIDYLYQAFLELSWCFVPAITMSITVPCQSLPYYPEKRYTVTPGEYVFIEGDPQELKDKLQVFVKDDTVYKLNNDDWMHTGENYLDDVYDYDMMHIMKIREKEARFMRRGPFHRRPMEDDEDDYDLRMDMMDEMYRGKFPHKRMFGGFNRRPRTILDKVKDGKRGCMQKIVVSGPCNARKLMEEIYPLWNGILKQKVYFKEDKDLDIEKIYNFLENVYDIAIEDHVFMPPNKNSIQYRLANKRKLSMMHEFKKTIKGVKDSGKIDEEMKKEVTQAKEELKTTVQTKYQDKVLHMKGHSGKDTWQNDMRAFLAEYRKIKEQVQNQQQNDYDDCCRIYLQSIITDLQDPSFEMLTKDNDKFEFLKEITVTGIPVHMPFKESSQINPWTVHIQNILLNPYDILCQKVIEDTYRKVWWKEDKDKSVQLVERNKKTQFNIIVPLIPIEFTGILKDLVLTDVFAIICTYCILRNANIIDKNCHLAALGCVWMRSIREFPINKTRPEYIIRRIQNLEATAKIYLERHFILTYIEALLTKPSLALTTEAEETFNDVKIRCESLIKPCFLLFLAKDNIELLEKHGANLIKIVQLVLMEFIGRCISTYKSNTIYLDWFLPSVDETLKDKWSKIKADEIFKRMEVSGTQLLTTYPEKKGVQNYIKTNVTEIMKDMEEELKWEKMMEAECLMGAEERHKQRSEKIRSEWRYDYDSYDDEEEMDSEEEREREVIERVQERERMELFEAEEARFNAEKYQIVFLTPNEEKICKLSHSGSVGQVSWNDLKAWAQEMLKTLGPDGNPVFPSGSPPDQPMDQDGKPVAPPQRRPVCLIQEDIDIAFNHESVCAYIYHSLLYRSSRARLGREMASPSEAMQIIEKNVDAEWKQTVVEVLRKHVEETVMTAWQSAYDEAHKNLVIPMTREQIVEEAQRRGIDVTLDTFSQVYKYREKVGICRNCCQVRECPQYLIPNRHVNAHLEVERRDNVHFPHTLHLAVSRNVGDLSTTHDFIEHGRIAGTHKRKSGNVQVTENLDDQINQLKDLYSEFNLNNSK